MSERDYPVSRKGVTVPKIEPIPPIYSRPSATSPDAAPLSLALPPALQAPRRARRRRMSTLLALLAVLALLIIPFYVIYKPPAGLIAYFARRWPDVLWEVQTDKKVVALTIDDAPSQHTEEILEILNSHQATATFFVIGGQVAGREDVLADIVRSGSELGNHAMHDEPSRSLSDEELTNQIEAVRDKIRTAYKTGEAAMPPQYFRPGLRAFSAIA
ncbi:hypothetical protein CIB48_g442 [Xylaria polymorpha]|nr:hypothetical protein CIB48_g442 [Xylaria polymorpha]